MGRSKKLARHVRWAGRVALAATAAGLLAACNLPETSDSTTTTTTSTGSTLTEYPFNCWGDPSPDNTIDDCVVFARADAADPGDGTKEHPYTSLQTAIDEASKLNKRVFACGSAPFTGAIFVDAPIELWGGFDCQSDWHYSSIARTTIHGPADVPALTLSMSAAGALIVSIATTTPPSEKPGGSSIGVIVDEVQRQTFIWRCDITVGDGKDGLDGDPPSGPAKAGSDAPFAGDGAPTEACVAVASVAGGAPAENDCDDGKSIGGQGGPGGTAPNGGGQDGYDGMPLPPDNPTLAGLGGDGQSSVTACYDGTTGLVGTAGGAGHGAETKGHASVHGIDAVNGEPGTRGARGQGGGGGGGARAGVFCPSGPNTIEGPGASGGGGGAGGCGGKGGNGGMAGGDSVGLISLGGKLVVNYTTITVGRAGNGGKGAAGQPGGAGGKGAAGGGASGLPMSVPGCSGGDGGKGGPGGPGGGGRGGHSVGLAYYGKKPAMNYMHAVPLDKGKGGEGGPGNEVQGQGIDGTSAEYADFTSL